MKPAIFLFMACIFIIFSCKNITDRQKHLSDKDRMKFEANANPEIEKKIRELISEMTLEEKVSQMVQIIPFDNMNSS